MQLNFSLISHNFSSKNYQLVSLDFFYTIWLLPTFLVKVKFHRNYAIIYSYIYISCRDTFFKNTLLTKYLILITLYLSTLPLFNNFFWHKLDLNFINYPLSFFKITLIFIMILISFQIFNSLDNRTFILFFENGITSQNFFISHDINKILMSTLDVIPGLTLSLILILFLTFFYILLIKVVL